MHRTLLLGTIALALTVTPAQAESSYRIDRVTGATASFDLGRLQDGNLISTTVRFERAETVAASGAEATSSDLGLCVTVHSHFERLEPSDVYRSRWAERGCIDIAPVSLTPLRLTATIPTVIKITGGLLPEVMEERPSSITLDLTWTAKSVDPTRTSTCQPSGGPTSMSGLPLRVQTELGSISSEASVTGTISSETQGVLSEPRPQACFTESYYVAATLDPAP